MLEIMQRFAALNLASESVLLFQHTSVLAWVKNGLQFFHHMSYQDSLKIKREMIVEIKDGYSISFNNKNYWLPQNINPFFEK